MGGAAIILEEVREPGLERLSRGVKNPHLRLLTEANLEQLLDDCLNQLENDDRFCPVLTDQMVEALFEAQEMFHDGGDWIRALSRVHELHQRALSRGDLFDVWLDRATALKPQEIETELLLEFQEACRLIGEGVSPQAWLEHTSAQIQDVLRSYLVLPVAQQEVTMESEMCHDFLVRGTQAWLEALRLLGTGELDRARELAHFGQQLLVSVQLFEEEASRIESGLPAEPLLAA